MIWQEILKSNITTWKKLVDFLQIDLTELQHVIQRNHFTINIPLRLAKKIDKRALWQDPIFLQFVPQKEESQEHPNFSCDPLEEKKRRNCQSPKLMHKFPKRALLITTEACAMHCRYCFRREFDYPKNSGYEEEFLAIEKDSTLNEIILSGGDPLSLPNVKLDALIQRLERIPHIKRLRFHTRFPIGIPERIDEGFLNLLKKSRFSISFVIHLNHPIELDEDVKDALHKIKQLGIPVLNQAVLLKGVNDRAEVLEELVEKSMDAGIISYYLHQLDRVKGAAHFEVKESIGVSLMKELRSRCSGFGVFDYVREVPSRSSKIPIEDSFAY